MNYDVLVVGSGPAGLAAAVAARGRDKSVLVVGNPWQESPLARAERIDNYLGLPGVNGRELTGALQRPCPAGGGGVPHRPGGGGDGLGGVCPHGGQRGVLRGALWCWRQGWPGWPSTRGRRSCWAGG